MKNSEGTGFFINSEGTGLFINGDGSGLAIGAGSGDISEGWKGDKKPFHGEQDW